MTCHFYSDLNDPRPLAPYLCVMPGFSEEPRDWSERLQTKLMGRMSALYARLEETKDPAEIAQIEKEARTCGVFARSIKAVATMVPELKAKPAADEADDEDEASMHADIPDDPEALQAALVARFTHFAELLELKRRADQGDGDGPGGAGDGGSAAPA
jgi:hypothetical protein